MVSTRKYPHPRHSKPQLGGVTKVRIFSLRYEGFSSTLGTPTLRSCTGEMSPQNTCLWKPMRNVPRKTTELQRTENLLLKGCCADPPDLKTSIKTPYWKVHGPDVKGIHLVILKPLPERQKIVGMLFGDWNTGGSHFCGLRLLECQHWCMTFSNSPSNLISTSWCTLQRAPPTSEPWPSLTAGQEIALPTSMPQQLLLGSTAHPGTNPAHQDCAAVLLPQQKGAGSPHRSHPVSAWLWWPGRIVLLSSTGHLLNKVTPSRLEVITDLPNTW